ncbi:MAG: heavy-metal-associated domain-containing protein [Bacteroidetes bacterium]|nr:heavy-metal-associated domain-containing protein [Bacteroidota bacterium]MBS1539360.1 heavy-metal-associated domain-containing protein [Bacteroidota bacterium]
MENKTYQFKTNINCSGCVAVVKPHLDQAEGMGEWKVDTANKDKVLTVQSAGISEEQVMTTVQKAGYKIERLH